MNDLTKREQEILIRICRGLSNKIIADELGIAVGTVKVHASHLFRKLRVTNRMQALLACRQEAQ